MTCNRAFLDEAMLGTAGHRVEAYVHADAHVPCGYTGAPATNEHRCSGTSSPAPHGSVNLALTPPLNVLVTLVLNKIRDAAVGMVPSRVRF